MQSLISSHFHCFCCYYYPGVHFSHFWFCSMLYMPTMPQGDRLSPLLAVPIVGSHMLPCHGLLFAFQWLYINLQSRNSSFLTFLLWWPCMLFLLFTVMYITIISIFVFNAKTPLSVYRYVIFVCVCICIYSLWQEKQLNSESIEGMRALNLLRRLLDWAGMRDGARKVGTKLGRWGLDGKWRHCYFLWEKGWHVQAECGWDCKSEVRGWNWMEHKNKGSGPYPWSSDNSLGLRVLVQEMIGKVKVQRKSPTLRAR